MPAPPPLPQDADAVLRLAAQSMFDLFAQSAMGMMVVDRAHRVVWISEGYKRFLPALGFADEQQFVGKRVEEVVPNTLMAQVIDTGQAILVDLLSNQAGTFLVSRIPLRDERGRVLGAVGLVLLDHPQAVNAQGEPGLRPDLPGGPAPTMQPLMAKFARLQRELQDAQHRLVAEQVKNRRPKYTIASFIGSSAAALDVKRQARRVAATDATVLLLGDTGTGKELLAQAIHAASARAGGPFVGVNIAAVPEALLEAEFFGVAPGAYTGAERKGRDGKFKVADGGTLFLDEIGDMPLALQSKLLRALQEREVEALGSNQVLTVDVRVIAATSRDLAAMVAEGRFRADLYYRLAVLPIRLPRLAERLDDVEALAEALLDDIARRSGLPPRSLSHEALDALLAHPWPGNIRELRNVLEQAALMTDDAVLGPAHLALSGAGAVAVGAPPVAPAAPRFHPLPAAAVPPDEVLAQPLPQAVAALEARAIRAALSRTGGNKQAAARLLGIGRATLYEKLAARPELADGAPG